jgi:pimeloyl-ACP methyl ester carboxylesterase
MAEKLVILSDMWGVKKGLWITSYFGYLQQYYNIEFYDCQQLGHVDVTVNTEENIHDAFVNGGIDTAVAHLLKKETQPAHYLAFSTGGTIAWKAGLKGLPMKSLTAISPTRIRFEKKSPACAMDIVFGENDSFQPDAAWAKQMAIKMEVVPNFGHQLYSDDKIIGEICLRLLQRITIRKAV